MKKDPRYLKRFEGWVTGLQSKYWHDIFFRTELNVILLQVVFAMVLSVMVAVSFNHFYKDLLQTLSKSIAENIRDNHTFTAIDIIDSIQVVKARNFRIFFSLTVFITLFFSYIIAKITLYPARTAIQSQKRFVSNISHELRTPLSVIKTNSEVALLDEDVDPSSKKIFVDIIEELDRTSAIINNLLTFNKLVHPEKIKFSPVDLGIVVDTVVRKLEELVKKKEVKVTIKKTNPSIVMGNTVALEQIVLNLVKNAINYNHTGGSVTVRVEPDYKGNIVLMVEDNGIGISQNDLFHIFEPFYRAERSRNRHSGSSGLGLTIVSELVKLHSGKITVKSLIKQGTIVTILFTYSENKPAEGRQETLSNEVSVDFLKG